MSWFYTLTTTKKLCLTTTFLDLLEIKKGESENTHETEFVWVDYGV